MSGLKGGDMTVTRAQIWANEFYEGQPFHTTLWPPPRPTPDAELSALYVIINGPANGVSTLADGSLTFSFTNDPVGPMQTVSPEAATAVVSFAPEGLDATFAGPPSSHVVLENGEARFPLDDLTMASGAIGSFMGAVVCRME